MHVECLSVCSHQTDREPLNGFFIKFRIGDFIAVRSVYSSDENGPLDYQQEVSPTPVAKTRQPIVEAISTYHTEKTSIKS